MPILGGCLCFDLPTGSKIIGGLYLFAAIINVLLLTVVNIMLWVFDFLIQLADMLQEQQYRAGGAKPSLNFAVTNDDDQFLGLDLNTYNVQPGDIGETIKKYQFGFKVFFIVLLTMALLSIVSSSMLIHGVRKSRRGLLVPWVVQEGLHFILALTIVIVVFVLLGAIKIAWTLTLPIIGSFFLQVFFVIVVVSQYQALGLIRMHDEMCMK